VKVEDPPPNVDIPYDDVKVYDSPSLVVPPDVVVSIDHQEQFTTKQKFATRNDLMWWVREEARKLGFSTIIDKSYKGGNDINSFVRMIYESGGSYTECKNFSRRRISGSVKCECMFRVRGYLLIVGDWSLKVWDDRRNHEMANVLKRL